MRAMGHTAALAVRRANRALSRTAGPLLAKEFAGTAGDLATSAGVVRAESSVGLLAHHRLVHHRNIRLDPKDILGELNSADLVTGLIEEFCFHIKAYPSIISGP